MFSNQKKAHNKKKTQNKHIQTQIKPKKGKSKHVKKKKTKKEN